MCINKVTNLLIHFRVSQDTKMINFLSTLHTPKIQKICYLSFYSCFICTNTFWSAAKSTKKKSQQKIALYSILHWQMPVRKMESYGRNNLGWIVQFVYKFLFVCQYFPVLYISPQRKLEETSLFQFLSFLKTEPWLTSMEME